MHTTAIRRCSLLATRRHRYAHRSTSYEEAKQSTVRSWKRLLLFLLLTTALLYEPIITTEEEPHWDRLKEEVLCKEPRELMEEVRGSGAKGVRIYVLDTGTLAPQLAVRVKEVVETGVVVAGDLEDLDAVLAFERHGSMVVSRLIGQPASLAPDADIHYYQVHHYWDAFLAYHRLSRDVSGPAVVITSHAVTVNSLVLRMLVQWYLDRITRRKGIAFFCAAMNDGYRERPVGLLPVSCDGVWPVGSLTRSQDGATWLPHATSGQGAWVPFFAPGTSIPLILHDPFFHPDARIIRATGTSFAAPAAAACGARVLSLYPWMNRRDLGVAMEYIAGEEELPFMDDSQRTFRTRCLILE